MRARVVAALSAALLMVPTTGIATAADPGPLPTSPPPPTITPLCVTDKEYVRTISGDVAVWGDAIVEYTTKQTDDWTPPNARHLWLSPGPSGGSVGTVYTSRMDGTSLHVRWWIFPSQASSTSWAPSGACEPMSLRVMRVVQGGNEQPDAFPVTVTRLVVSLKDPVMSESIPAQVTSDTPQSISAGEYMVGPTKEGDSYAPLPAGYVFRESSCSISQKGAQGSTRFRTTEQEYQRVVVTLDPGSTTTCTVTYHYGPVLDDSIGAGKRTTGTEGFATAPITVKKGTWVTYLVATSPSLAGKKVQIWTKAGSAATPWKLTKTVRVTSDGTIRYYAKVTTYTGFQARWVGDRVDVASAADGRYVKVR
jgi:hypothetical protein